MKGKLFRTRGALPETETIGRETVKHPVKVDIFDNFDALEPIQQEWDKFVESVGGEIFLTYDWCRIWWKYYGTKRDLRIFVFRSDGKLVGIIPLFFEKIWLGPIFVRGTKIVGSDFTLAQFSLPIHSKHIREVIEEFSKLLSENNWDIIHIGPIAGLYKYYDDLKNVCEELLGHSHIILSKNKGVQTYFELARSWDEQLASLKKGERWDIRRSYKALHSQTNGLFSAFAPRENFQWIFENFVDMHQSYWRRLGKLGHFGDWPAAQDFHCEVAAVQLRHNRLRLLEVRAGKQYLGYEYSCKFGDRYFEFLNARSQPEELAKISVGRVVFSELVKQALKESVRCIDSMRGKYEHKLRMGGKLFPVRSIFIYPLKLDVLIRVFIFRTLAYLLDLCYYRIWFCRIAPRLPFKRRPLWKIWIRTRAFA